MSFRLQDAAFRQRKSRSDEARPAWVASYVCNAGAELAAVVVISAVVVAARTVRLFGRRAVSLVMRVAAGAAGVGAFVSVLAHFVVAIRLIAAVVGAIIAAVIVAARVIRVVSEAFAAIIATYGAAIPVMKIGAVIVATSVISMIQETVAAIVELAGARRRCDVRAAVIERGELRAIVAGFVAMLHLIAGRVEVAIMIGELFFTIRTSIDAATAAIEADAVPVSIEAVIDAAVVKVADYVYVDAIDGAVVEELATAPFAAEETDARITETVVDAAVEADMASPIAAMPDVNAVTPAPIAGRPEQAGFRSHYPCSRNPIVAVIAIGPVAGRPDIAGPGAERLFVNGKSGRTDSDRHADADLRLRGGRYGEKHERKQEQMQETIFTHRCHLDKSFALQPVKHPGNEKVVAASNPRR